MSESLVWLITGCSAGLGSAIAKAVLAHGNKVIASSRNPSKSPDLVQDITSKGGHWIALDTTAPDLEDIVVQAEAIHGRLDVVVNNAGQLPLVFMTIVHQGRPEMIIRTLLSINKSYSC